MLLQTYRGIRFTNFVVAKGVLRGARMVIMDGLSLENFAHHSQYLVILGLTQKGRYIACDISYMSSTPSQILFFFKGTM